MNLPPSINQDRDQVFRNEYTPRADPRATSNQEPDWGSDRKRFHDMLLQKMGGDPYAQDPEDFVKLWNERQSGKHFDKFFKGRASKQDWKHLPKSYRKAWNKEARRVHTVIREKSKKKIDDNREKYKLMMQRFIAEQGRAKKEHTAKNKKNKIRTDKQTADAMDKARTHYNSVIKSIPAKDDPDDSSRIIKWREGVDQIPPAKLKKINNYKKLRNLPQLVETYDEETGNYSYNAEEEKQKRRASKKALWRLQENPHLIDEFVKHYGYKPEGF